MKIIFKIALLAGFAGLMSSCKNDLEPNYQYMPNMYEPVSYETYEESDAFKNGKEGQLPPEGTINRGYVPYGYANTTEGYDLAKANLQMPRDTTLVNMEQGKALFDIYCAICHGASGNGKGKLVEREKFLGVPSYKDRVITTGSVFHVETFGLNSMGSYANQLSTEERWMVAAYVMKLKSEL